MRVMLTKAYAGQPAGVCLHLPVRDARRLIEKGRARLIRTDAREMAVSGPPETAVMWKG